MEWWIDVALKAVIAFLLASILDRVDVIKKITQEHHRNQRQQ